VVGVRTPRTWPSAPGAVDVGPPGRSGGPVRDSVLECGRPLPLWIWGTGLCARGVGRRGAGPDRARPQPRPTEESGRGLPHSKTWRPRCRRGEGCPACWARRWMAGAVGLGLALNALAGDHGLALAYPVDADRITIDGDLSTGRPGCRGTRWACRWWGPTDRRRRLLGVVPRRVQRGGERALRRGRSRGRRARGGAEQSHRGVREP